MCVYTLSRGSERPHKAVSNFSKITSASIKIPGKDRVESDPADVWCCRCRLAMSVEKSEQAPESLGLQGPDGLHLS